MSDLIYNISSGAEETVQFSLVVVQPISFGDTPRTQVHISTISISTISIYKFSIYNIYADGEDERGQPPHQVRGVRPTLPQRHLAGQGAEHSPGPG